MTGSGSLDASINGDRLRTMSKQPRKEVIKDEPGAEDRFMRGITKALNTPPKPFTPVKDKPKKGKGTRVSSSPEPLEHAVEVIHCLFNLLKFGGELASVDVDPSATRAGHAGVVLKPSDTLLRVSAAMTAWDLNFLLIKH